MSRRDRAGVALLLAVACVFSPLRTYAAEVFPGATWDRVEDLRAAGWDASKLDAADKLAGTLSTDAYLVIDRGRIVHEYGATRLPTNVHSVRKSVLNLLVGIAVGRGAIDLSRTMADLGIDDVDALTASERSATVQQLLQARSGIYHPAAYETKAMAALRPARGTASPGVRWYYNNWDFNALGTIFERATGKPVFAALLDDLANPLGFEHFTPAADTRLRYEPTSQHPAYTMRLSARDMARVGLLVLREGRWHARQVVPEGWIAASLTAYTEGARRGVGYGYLWWIGEHGRHFRHAFPGKVVSARGHRGQYIVIDFARELVIVHKVNSELDSRRRVSAAEFGQLLALVLQAKER